MGSSYSQPHVVLKEVADPEADLASAVSDRAPAAFAALTAEDTRALVTHLPDLERQARRLIANASDAKDLVQDTMERAVRSYGQFQRGTNLRAWLYTIMARRATDVFRRQKNRNREPIDPAQVPAPEPAEPSVWTTVSDEQFRRAVQQLKPIFREVFELHEMHNLQYQDIADRLAIPSSTVGTRLRRARQHLRDLLDREMKQDRREAAR
jgi:RNA polymerase sigma-70 factor, ECF subfamily